MANEWIKNNNDIKSRYCKINKKHQFICSNQMKKQEIKQQMRTNFPSETNCDV